VSGVVGRQDVDDAREQKHSSSIHNPIFGKRLDNKAENLPNPKRTYRSDRWSNTGGRQINTQFN
jgi:hypothetical protein